MISAETLLNFNYLIACSSEYLSTFTVQLEKIWIIFPQTPYSSWEKALLSSAYAQSATISAQVNNEVSVSNLKRVKIHKEVTFPWT